MTRSILLCPPVFYDVRYSINPWMKGENVNNALAMQQWFQLKNTLQFMGINVHLIDQHPDLPDMVFTANAGTVKGGDVVLSKFKHSQRQNESAEFEEWFNSMGYQVHHLDRDMLFEGCGDTVINGKKIIGGYGFRSNLKGLRAASEILQLELISVKLKNPQFYHLDTCFTMLNDELALYYPGAFSKYTISKLKEHFELIPVDSAAAHKFVCNSIVSGQDILMPAGNESTANMLEDYGFRTRLINTAEFLKSGGSLQCMALWI